MTRSALPPGLRGVAPEELIQPLRSWLPAGLAIAALCLGGCTSTTLGGVNDRDDLAQALYGRGLDPSFVILPYELSDEMRRFAREAVPSHLSPEEKLQRLQQRLLETDHLKLEYAWGYTGTAAEVFESRRANCLAFTNLFLGMARDVGVPVFFLGVDNVETYRREGDLVVVSDHIAVGLGDLPGIHVYDFSEHRDNAMRSVHPIPDLLAIAMFHSNRGAEALQEGKIPDAIGWLRTAVAIEPEMAPAWVNLGVGLRRYGDLDGAESAYRKALEIDPTIFSAYHNLVSLLHLQDRDPEARQFQQALEKASNRNPYTYLTLGDISLRSGRLEEAKRFYRRAVSLSCEAADCYAALGQLAVATGDLRTARKMLKKASKLDVENYRTQQLSNMLAKSGDKKS